MWLFTPTRCIFRENVNLYTKYTGRSVVSANFRVALNTRSFSISCKAKVLLSRIRSVSFASQKVKLTQLTSMFYRFESAKGNENYQQSLCCLLSPEDGAL